MLEPTPTHDKREPVPAEPKKYKRSSSPGVTAYECLWDEKNNGKHTHECNNCGEVGNQHTKECQDDQDNGVRIVRPKVRA